MPYQYYTLDVFTDQKFGGNPLAVFPEADSIPEDLFQKIARELNLSETTFVLLPTDSRCDYKVRIFTPLEEIPMAGHPTIGTAFVLSLLDHISEKQHSQRYVFEEKIGPIPVDLKFQGGIPDLITMTQPTPTFCDLEVDPELLADVLSLKVEDIEIDFPVQKVSTGLPFVFVPVRSLESIRKIRFNQENSPWACPGV